MNYWIRKYADDAALECVDEKTLKLAGIKYLPVVGERGHWRYGPDYQDKTWVSFVEYPGCIVPPITTAHLRSNPATCSFIIEGGKS